MSSELPSRWKTFKIGDLCEVFDGPHATPKTTTVGPVFLGVSNLDGGRLDLTETRHVSEADFISWTRRIMPRAGDVVFSYETRLGEAALIPDGLRCCLGRRMGLLRVRPDAPVTPRFLLLAYLGPQFQRVIRDRAIAGSTVDRIPLKQLGEFPMVLPPLDEQRRIVEVLGSFGDKIESNQAIAHLLHAIAEQAYRRALGASQPARLGDLGTIRGGGTPKSSVPAYWDPPEVAWVTPKDMTALAGSPVIWRGERNISQLGLQKSSAKLLPAGTVLYTSRATLGMIAIAQQELSTNQGFITVEPAPGLSSELVYFTLRENRDAIAAKANGSTFLEVNKTNFKAVECRIPDEGARAVFQSVAGPAFRLIAGLAQETQRLREVRDLLLPKLVSGQIRVPAGVEPRGEAKTAALAGTTA